MNLTAGRPNSSQFLGRALACCSLLLLPLLLLSPPPSPFGHSASTVLASSATANSSSNSSAPAASRPSNEVSAGDEPTMQINAKANTTSGGSTSRPDWIEGGSWQWTPSEWPQSEPIGATVKQQQRPPPPPPQTDGSDKHYRLPSWFNHNAFKQLYGKRYKSRFADEFHKRIYLETALKVFQQRALYRAGRLGSLASVNELSDMTGEQLDEFREQHKKQTQAATTTTATTATTSRRPAPARDGNGTTGPADEAGARTRLSSGQLPECCSYDQVFTRIIRLLQSATSSNDDALSRALVDELKQRALVEEPEAGQVGADLRAHSRGQRDGASAHNAEQAEAEREAERSRQRAVVMALDEQIAGVRSNTSQQQQQQQQRQPPTTTMIQTIGNKQKTYHQQAPHSLRLPADPSGSHPNGKPRQQHQTAGGGAQVIERTQARPPRPEVVSDGQRRAEQWRGPTRTSSRPPGANRLVATSAATATAATTDVEDEMSRQIGEAVRAQIADQLGPNSATGRELNKQLSAYFGQPVELRARLAGGVPASDKTASGPVAPPSS